ncbi:uroporphyrinogen-III C-methyltransferase [Pseudothauera nasutitermitis]|uniref:uroporphyrinogen-III C-methyltransferase n=1 Tax=Pseudothauera nasutitermitis TaxID=2565930 RepID=UPI001E63B520|nr:uroporphyrinogen-III C-methyltransferase [Pseudothauera nasutitermitis]
MNGTVYLVGAGPGDPELLTLKAARLLAGADAIVCDRLVGDGVAAYANPHAQWHRMGKQAGCSHLQQREINALLLRLAREGKTVVRLKGGDPFVFGRGGEEMLYLAEHGIVVEVVPGITAATGCAAALGLPLTHRGVATSLRFVTGHLRDDADLDLDWRSLADPDCTLVFYMAVANAAAIAAALVAHGMPPSTPAMFVRAGTTAKQASRAMPISRVPQAAALFKPPALLIVGNVVSLRHAVPRGIPIAVGDAAPAPQSAASVVCVAASA